MLEILLLQNDNKRKVYKSKKCLEIMTDKDKNIYVIENKESMESELFYPKSTYFHKEAVEKAEKIRKSCLRTYWVDEQNKLNIKSSHFSEGNHLGTEMITMPLDEAKLVSDLLFKILS